MTMGTEDTLSDPMNFLTLLVLPAVGNSKTIIGVGHLKGHVRMVVVRPVWDSAPNAMMPHPR